MSSKPGEHEQWGWRWIRGRSEVSLRPFETGRTRTNEHFDSGRTRKGQELPMHHAGLLQVNYIKNDCITFFVYNMKALSKLKIMHLFIFCFRSFAKEIQRNAHIARVHGDLNKVGTRVSFPVTSSSLWLNRFTITVDSTCKIIKLQLGITGGSWGGR